MDHFQKNRESWNNLTPLHVNSDFYDVAGFRQGKSSLNTIELNELGNVRDKTLLHLQCHFGLDTLSFARLGAKVTGVDISDESIEAARALSKELDIPADFIRENIYDLPERLTEKFDLVYTSYGAINWLDNLDRWAKIIYSHLKPGGTFYMVEFHPFIYTLGDGLEITKSYFNTGRLESIVESSYTENSTVKGKMLKHSEWHHSLSDLINSLIRQGLTIKQFNEFNYQPYNCFDNMLEIVPGKWVFEKYGTKIPYLFSVQAVKL